MDRYKPVDITKKAKALCKEFPISEEKPHPFVLPHSHRIMEKDKNGATKRRDYRSGAVRKNEPERLKLKTMGTDGFAIGKQTVDLRYLEQLIDSEQTACLGMLLKYAVEHLVDGKRTIAEVVVQLQKELERPACVFWQKTVSFPAVMPCRGCRRCIPVLTVIVYRKREAQERL